jgi:hypothetical protein
MMMQGPIRAELFGFDTCTALGIEVRAYAPALAMCRKLVEAGHDPGRPLHAYRRDVLALTVSSIGWGAGYTVSDSNIGRPMFCRWRGQESMPAGPPMRGTLGATYAAPTRFTEGKP